MSSSWFDWLPSIPTIHVQHDHGSTQVPRWVPAAAIVAASGFIMAQGYFVYDRRQRRSLMTATALRSGYLPLELLQRRCNTSADYLRERISERPLYVNRPTVEAEIRKHIMYSIEHYTNQIGTVIHGPKGCGKTTLLEHVLHELISDGYLVILCESREETCDGIKADLGQVVEEDSPSQTFFQLSRELGKHLVIVMALTHMQSSEYNDVLKLMRSLGTPFVLEISKAYLSWSNESNVRVEEYIPPLFERDDVMRFTEEKDISQREIDAIMELTKGFPGQIMGYFKRKTENKHGAHILEKRQRVLLEDLQANPKVWAVAQFLAQNFAQMHRGSLRIEFNDESIPVSLIEEVPDCVEISQSMNARYFAIYDPIVRWIILHNRTPHGDIGGDDVVG